MKRVLIVLVALVATPFVVGLSQGQGQGHDAAHCAKRAAQHPDKDINKCPVTPTNQPPPPPTPGPSCTASGPSTGTASISGNVYNDLSSGRTGLASWCVELTGTVTATAVTDASGNYTFSGLPDGSYTVCEDLQDGWQETFPQSSWGTPCATGFGWSFDISGGSPIMFVNFGNVKL